MKFSSTVADIADMSPTCSIIVAIAIGAITRIAVTSNLHIWNLGRPTQPDDVTEAKLHIVRESDAILREEIARAGLDREIWQYFTVLTNLQSVGVMGDERTYDYALGIRAVTSIDGMTADWAKIPYDVLAVISNRIVNEVKHVNRVLLDITSKPPGTIEFE